MIYAELNTKVSNFGVIPLDCLESIVHTLRNIGLAEVDRPLELVITHDWHEAWNKGCLDTDGLAVSDPFKIHLVIKEQLRNNDVSSCVALLLEMLDVILSAHCLEMCLWVSCHNDAKVVAISFLDESHQLSSITKSIFYRSPVFDTMWWVTSQSKDIFDSVLLGLFEGLDDLFSSHARAGEMHEDIYAHILGNMSAEVESSIE